MLSGGSDKGSAVCSKKPTYVSFADNMALCGLCSSLFSVLSIVKGSGCHDHSMRWHNSTYYVSWCPYNLCRYHKHEASLGLWVSVGAVKIGTPPYFV